MIYALFRLFEILALIYAGCALFLFVFVQVLKIRKPKEENSTWKYTRRTYSSGL